MRIIKIVSALLFTIVCLNIHGQENSDMGVDSVELDYIQLTNGVNFPTNKSGEIEYSLVVEIDGRTKEDLFEAFIDFGTTDKSRLCRGSDMKSYTGMTVMTGQVGQRNNVNNDAGEDCEIKYSDKESATVTMSVFNKYWGSNIGCLRMVVMEYILKLEAKDNKYRCTISGFNYTHYNMATGKEENIWGQKCMSKGSINELFMCTKCEEKLNGYGHYLSKDIGAMINEIKKHVEEESITEDW
jgi:hypothetical protein